MVTESFESACTVDACRRLNHEPRVAMTICALEHARIGYSAYAHEAVAAEINR